MRLGGGCAIELALVCSVISVGASQPGVLWNSTRVDYHIILAFVSWVSQECASACITLTVDKAERSRLDIILSGMMFKSSAHLSSLHPSHLKLKGKSGLHY